MRYVEGSPLPHSVEPAARAAACRPGALPADWRDAHEVYGFTQFTVLPLMHDGVLKGCLVLMGGGAAATSSLSSAAGKPNGLLQLMGPRLSILSTPCMQVGLLGV